MTIRKQVSQLLGVGIAQDQWDETFARLAREGKIDQKKQTEILILILKRLEEHENKSI